MTLYQAPEAIILLLTQHLKFPINLPVNMKHVVNLILILQVNEEYQDIKIDFLRPHGPHKAFHWPRDGNTCYVPTTNILCKISVPLSATATGRSYKITDEDYNNTVSSFEKYKSSN